MCKRQNKLGLTRRAFMKKRALGAITFSSVSFSQALAETALYDFKTIPQGLTG